MTKRDIIDNLARERVVEKLIEHIAHRHLNTDLKDLSQMVYLILLEYDEEKIVELWEHGEMNFFIARIILNQYRSATSSFHYEIRRYIKASFELNTEINWDDEQGE